MPGVRCAVAFCNNSRMKTISSKETIHIMYYSFPKNLERRKKWISFCGRKDDLNPNTSRICSVHFTEDQYESDRKTELLKHPQKKMLKNTAVPTLFSSNKDSANKCSVTHEQQCNLKIATVFTLSRVPSIMECVTEPLSHHNYSRCTAQNTVADLQSMENLKRDIAVLQQQLKVSNDEISELKYKGRTLTKSVRSLKREKKHFCIEYKKIQSCLNRCLTQSQQEVLINNNKKVKWENKILSSALALRYVSQKAYTYLKKNLNYPLPAPSTLRQWASSFKLKEDVLKEVFKITKTENKNGQKSVISRGSEDHQHSEPHSEVKCPNSEIVHSEPEVGNKTEQSKVEYLDYEVVPSESVEVCYEPEVVYPESEMVYLDSEVVHPESEVIIPESQVVFLQPLQMTKMNAG